MTDIIERLEAATEGTCGLDYEIHEWIGWRDDDECGWFHEPTETRSTRTDWPPYTTSIDAALTLVPEGWCLQLFECDGGWKARLKSIQRADLIAPFEFYEEPDRLAATAALAISECALKAKKAAPSE